MPLREKTKQIISTQHIPKECAPQHLQVIKVNTWSIFIELAGLFPVLKSPYLRRFLKTRINLRRTSGMYSRTGPHCWFLSLNHNSTETGQNNSLSGNFPEWPFNASDVWAKKICRCTPKVTFWPQTHPVFLLHSKGMCALSFSQNDLKPRLTWD